MTTAQKRIYHTILYICLVVQLVVLGILVSKFFSEGERTEPALNPKQTINRDLSKPPVVRSSLPTQSTAPPAEEASPEYPPLAPGWVRVRPSLISNALAMTDKGFELDKPLINFLNLTNNEQEELDRLAVLLTDKIKEIELENCVALKDESGWYIQLSSPAAKADELRSSTRKALTRILGEDRGGTFNRLIAQSKWFTGLEEPRNIMFTIDEERGAIFFNDGLMGIGTSLAASEVPDSHAIWKLMDRYSHIADFSSHFRALMNEYSEQP